MYAVICEPSDRCALWAADRLRVHLGEVRLVSVDLLALTADFQLSIGDAAQGGADGDCASILLPDGTRLGTDTCRGVLNRVSRAPRPAVAGQDAAYAAEEMMAIALAFLAGFNGRCVNRPDPSALAGRDPGAQGWLHMAALAGLPAVPFALGEASPRPLSQPVSRLLVIGERVFGGPAALGELAYDLARLAGLSLMSLSLDAAGMVVGVSALPDLSLAGEAGAGALADVLRGQT